MELFTGLSLKAWLCLGLLLAALVGMGYYEHLQHEVAAQHTTIVQQKATIAVQADTIQVAQVTKKIDESIQTQVTQDERHVTEQHDAVAQKLSFKEHQIDLRYNVTPITIPDLGQEQLELSTARIDSLWSAYCNAQPAAAACQGDSHAS